MKIYCRYRTRYIEWFNISAEGGIQFDLIFNDKDRSSDFSVDKDLLRLKQIDSDMDKEYVGLHLFAKNSKEFEKFSKEIYDIVDGLSHNLENSHWLFVHFAKNPHKEVVKYLRKWGVTMKMWWPPNNPKKFKYLSQD